MDERLGGVEVTISRLVEQLKYRGLLRGRGYSGTLTVKRFSPLSRRIVTGGVETTEQMICSRIAQL